MQDRLLAWGLRIVFGLLVFAVLVTAILIRPAKWLSDFDQSFYLTIAYDLNHQGVFSNGVFDKVDSTAQAPPAGMFFGPVYPSLVWAAMKIDGRFAAAVRCSVEAINEHGLIVDRLIHRDREGALAAMRSHLRGLFRSVEVLSATNAGYCAVDKRAAPSLPSRTPPPAAATKKAARR